MFHRNSLLPLGSKVKESLVNKSSMQQRSTENVNSQPIENLMEMSSESDSEEEILLVSKSPRVILKKGNDTIVAESGSEIADTFQDGDNAFDT